MKNLLHTTSTRKSNLNRYFQIAKGERAKANPLKDYLRPFIKGNS